MPDETDELKNPNPKTRSRAAYLIGQNRQVQFVPDLAKALKDEDVFVRWTAAFSLGNFGLHGRQAAGALLHAVLHDADVNVREQAITALSSIGWESLPGDTRITDLLQDNSLSVRLAGAHALWSRDANADLVLPIVAEALESADRNVRWRAVSLSGQVGPAAKDAVPALTKALQDREGSFRFHVAHALAKIGPAAATAICGLISLLADEEEKVRLSVPYALGRIGPSAVPALMEALDNHNATIQEGAAGALGWMGTDGHVAITALMEPFYRASARFRERAAFAFGAMGRAAQAALPILRNALHDEGWLVRATAAQAIWRITQASAGLIAVLRDALGQPDKVTRLIAADTLGRIGAAAKEALPALTQALNDADATIRVAAALALWRIERQTQLEIFTEALTHGSYGARSSAIAALEEIGPDAAPLVTPLQQMLNDGDPYIRERAAKALEKIQRSRCC